MKTIAQRLKYARDTYKNWTQIQLAAAAEMSQSTIGNIEAGIREGRGSLPKIAKALGVSHDWLADGDGEMLAVAYTQAPKTSPPRAVEPAKTYILGGSWPFDSVPRDVWNSLSERQKGEVEFYIKQLAGAANGSAAPQDKPQKMAY